MDFRELEELIEIFERSGLSEIEVEEKGRRMRLQKALPAPIQPAHLVIPPPEALPPPDPAASSEPDVEEAQEAELPTINSPMVGTFYAAPAPGEEPFIREGDPVEENQTVCIVEAMKLMNEVAAKFAGIIEKILVENGQPVEFGQPLFAVRSNE